jgi:hypothetical protein
MSKVKIVAKPQVKKETLSDVVVEKAVQSVFNADSARQLTSNNAYKVVDAKKEAEEKELALILDQIKSASEDGESSIEFVISMNSTLKRVQELGFKVVSNMIHW